MEKRAQGQVENHTESKPVPARGPQDVQADYDRLCRQAGDLQYRIFAHETELQEINEKLFALNQEFRAMQAEAAKTAAEEAKASQGKRTRRPKH